MLRTYIRMFSRVKLGRTRLSTFFITFVRTKGYRLERILQLQHKRIPLTAHSHCIETTMSNKIYRFVDKLFKPNDEKQTTPFPYSFNLIKLQSIDRINNKYFVGFLKMSVCS